MENEEFNMTSDLLSHGRNRIEPDELLRLRIVCPEPLEKICDGTTGTEQHIMIHDRWINHVASCDACKQHVMQLFMDLAKRIDLFSPSMLRKLISTVSAEALKGKASQLDPAVREKYREAMS